MAALLGVSLRIHGGREHLDRVDHLIRGTDAHKSLSIILEYSLQEKDRIQKEIPDPLVIYSQICPPLTNLIPKDGLVVVKLFHHLLPKVR